MPEFDEFDDLLGDFAPDDADGSASGGGSSPELDETAERRAHLVSLIEKSTGLLKQLAEEALASLDERIAKVEKQRLADEAIAALEAGDATLEDQAIRDGLRAEVEINRRRAGEAAVTEFERSLRRQGFGEETIAERVAAFRAADADVDAFLAQSDALYEHPLVIEAQRRAVERARARHFAQERLLGSIEEDAAAAWKAVDEALAMAAAE